MNTTQGLAGKIISKTSGKLLPLTAFLLICLLLVPFLVNHALTRDLSRDEHQFVAGGALLARQHLLPYKDYPYFHVPYLVPVFATACLKAESPLKATRLSSVFFGLACLALIYFWTYETLSVLFLPGRILASLAVVIFLSLNTLFLYTSGRAWNHDLGTFLGLLSFLLHHKGLRAREPSRWLLASGIALGLACGVRLSWAPLVLPFLLAIFFLANEKWSAPRWKPALVFMVGLGLAGLPIFLLFALYPRDVIFGMLVYPGKLTTQHWEQLNYTKAMDWPGKFSYFIHHIFASVGDYQLFGTYAVNRLLFMGTLLFSLPLLAAGFIKKQPGYTRSAFLLYSLPFVALGSMLPSPNMYQYYYQMVPFCLLALACALPVVLNLNLPRFTSSGLKFILTAVAVYCLVVGAHHMWADIRLDRQWQAMQVHQTGLEIKRLIGSGKVLTLTPVYPLEAKLQIYPEFATGPFAMRVAHLLNPEDRRRFKMVAPQDLDDFLRDQPPAAILTGFEKWDNHLVDFARRHGYKPKRLNNTKAILWLKAGPKQPGG